MNKMNTESIGATSPKEILDKYPKSLQVVKELDLLPNSWNPNSMPSLVFDSLKKSITKYGWLQYPVVRNYVGQYQIIDGEHRCRAAHELGLDSIQVVVLGTEEQQVTDSDAMTLTQLLNARGQDDVLKRAELLKKLKDNKQEDLFGLLPMTIKDIESQLNLLNFDFKQFENSASEETIAEGAKALKLVEDLEKELRKLHANSESQNFRLLLEQFFEWAKVAISNLEVT